MAPFSLLTASVSVLAKSFSVLSCTSTLARCTSVLPTVYVTPVKCLTSQVSGPPKKPVNGFIRFCMQYRQGLSEQNPGIKASVLVKMASREWRMMSPEQKQPFEEHFLQELEQFNVDLKRYKDQLTPAQIQQRALERRQKIAKRKARRVKRELNFLGKPKGPRSAFNIYMSEHHVDFSGIGFAERLQSVCKEWRNVPDHQKQVYAELAKEDRIRYDNEMKSWEKHMTEIGREDLVRQSTLSTMKRAKRASEKAEKMTTAKGKSKTTN